MTGTTPLRQRHREQTVELIIDAFSALTASKPHFTMQDVADTAGVSIRTLYRYYPNRQAMVDGLADRISEEIGQIPSSPSEFFTRGEESPTRRSFRVFGEHEALMRALVVSRLTGALTESGHRGRTERIRESIDDLMADAPEVVRRQVLGLLRLLSGSVAWMVLTDDDIGLTSDEAGAAVTWALHRLFDEPPGGDEFLE